MSEVKIEIKPRIFSKYAEYKDSGIDWLGKIPKDWDIKKLKYNFKYEKGGKAAEYTAEFISEHSGEYPVYSGQTEHGGIMGLVNRYDYDLQDEAIFSTTVGAKVMTPTIIKGKFCLSQNCLLMVKQSDQVIPRFFFYQLIPLFRKEKDLVPSHMQPSMRFSDLDTYFSAFPTKEIQRKTADFLDKETEKIDRLVEKKQKLIELLKEKRTALISQAVTKGLDSKVKMKDSGIPWLGQIPKHWEVKRLKYIGESIIGLTYSPDDIVDDENSGILVLRSSNIQNDNLMLNDNVYVKKEIPERLIVKEGDILICARNGSKALIGKNVCLHKEIKGATFGAFMAVFRSDCWNFLSYFFKSGLFMSQLSSTLTTTVNQLTNYYLDNITIVLPSKEEQSEIIVYLKKEIDRFNKTEMLIKKQIEKIKEYRTTLISAAVTGKIKV